MKIWLKSIADDAPAFRLYGSGQPPIISILNLKGGVGKTTLTANLALTLHGFNRRVLVVDLDYQGSLTAKVLPGRIHTELLDQDRHIRHVFSGSGDVAQRFAHCTASLGERFGLVAAEERLVDWEEDALTRWHEQPTSDPRFILRQALHHPRIQGRYDTILLDCPPRLTTACINGLAASDFVLIPTLLDETSAQGIPRLLRWLSDLRNGPCAQLSILGIVANRIFPRPSLIASENQTWSLLQDISRMAWNEPLHFFRTMIKDSRPFAAHELSIESGVHSAISSAFKDLTVEIQERVSSKAQTAGF